MAAENKTFLQYQKLESTFARCLTIAESTAKRKSREDLLNVLTKYKDTSGKSWTVCNSNRINCTYEVHCYGENVNGETQCNLKGIYVGLSGLDTKNGESNSPVRVRWNDHVNSINDGSTSIGEHFKTNHEDVFNWAQDKGFETLIELLRFDIIDKPDGNPENVDLRQKEQNLFLKHTKARGVMNKKCPCVCNEE